MEKMLLSSTSLQSISKGVKCLTQITWLHFQSAAMPAGYSVGRVKIIGVGNGDPSSHEPDKIFDGVWQRHLFNGKCQ
jgi:hypothetical protein